MQEAEAKVQVVVVVVVVVPYQLQSHVVQEQVGVEAYPSKIDDFQEQVVV
jgi:hypothetical protein